MTNEERLAAIRARVESLDPEWGAVRDREDLLQIISEYEAEIRQGCTRIASYELEIKELKEEVARRMQVVHSGPAPFTISFPLEVEEERELDLGPPPGSTFLSQSQHTLAARIGRGERT